MADSHFTAQLSNHGLSEETAYAGTNTLKFRGDLTTQGWTPDSNIVIAGTGFGWAQMSCRMDRRDTCETEEKVISAAPILME